VDGMELDRQVAQLRQLAQEARDLASHLVQGGSVEWKSLAANRFRERLGFEAVLSRGCADRLDRAAGALAAHALAVRSGAADVAASTMAALR
jgi:hypothetical protein